MGSLGFELFEHLLTPFKDFFFLAER